MQVLLVVLHACRIEWSSWLFFFHEVEQNLSVLTCWLILIVDINLFRDAGTAVGLEGTIKEDNEDLYKAKKSLPVMLDSVQQQC